MKIVVPLSTHRTVQLSVRIRAGEPMVLLLHGLGCVKEVWDAAFEHEALRSFGLCSFDFPGHGSSPAGVASIGEYGHIASALADQLGARRTYVVGHSMGGAVALMQPRRWSGVVSVEGNLVAADCGIASGALAEGLAVEAEEPWAGWMASTDRSTLQRAARSLCGWSGAGTLLDAYLPLPWRAYIHGDRSGPHPALPAYLQHPVDGSGHFPMLDNPDGFYELLGAILEGWR